MQYPTISEYVKVFKNAGVNLDKLAHLTPVFNNHGEPNHMSDDFAVVFKMQHKRTGKYYVLKCFLKDQKERTDDVCCQITNEQNIVGASYSTSVKYIDFQSQGTVKKIPVLLADWVDEKSMEAFLSMNEDMTTSKIFENFNEAIIDEYGVIYSKDGRKLLSSPKELDGNYSIKKDTKIICDWAFEGCTSLRSLVVPESVISIGESAFDGCTSLSSLVIPNRLVSIKGNLFCGWYGELKCLSSFFICENNVLFDENKSTIISFRDQDVTSYVIPAGVTSIGNSAFYGCSSLSSLVIPDSVTSIENSAFEGCSSLSSLVIPDSVTRIGNCAFKDCDFLRSLVIPDSVTSIGDCAFEGCESLSSLVIPDSVTSIGEHAFCGWDGELICLSPCFIYENKVLFDKEKSKIISFRDKETTSYIIPDNVTSIGGSAFYGCKSLRSLVIPNGVTSIGNSAFYGCSSLRSLVIPNGVTSIGDRAFECCSSLSSLIIPNSVTSIGNSAFRYCLSLSSLVIPDGVTSIGDDAFYGCSSLRSLVIPNGVTSIGDRAFEYCNLSNTLRQELSSRFW